MQEQGYVSTAQVAAALGVGVSTIKRWVDGGVLPAHRTAGGHRKLLIADVLRLVHDQKFPHLDLRLLQAPFPPAAGVPALEDSSRMANHFYRQLLAGDAEGAKALLADLVRQGMAFERLGDSVVAPALVRVGQEWESGRIDVFHEHRASQVCEEALVALKTTLRRKASPSGPLALGGAPEHCLHALSSSLVELVLLAHGWQVVNLGADIPFASLLHAIDELKPRLVWISVTCLLDPDRFLAAYRSFYEQARARNVAVAVGGRGLTPELRRQMEYTTFGDGLVHLAAFAQSLAPPARPRRPGRPGRSGKGPANTQT